MNRQKIRRLLKRVFLFWSFIPILFYFSSAPAYSLEVEWNNGRLSITAENILLDQILYEVARQTGLKIEVRGEFEEEFSVQFSNLSLLEGIQNLLSHINCAILLEETREPPEWKIRVTRVMVLGKGSKPPRTIQEEPGVDLEDVNMDGLPALYASGQQGDIGALKKALFNPNHTIQGVAFELLAQRDRKALVDLLADAAKSSEAEVRLQSLRFLHRTGIAESKVALAALGKAASDENTSVREYAIRALAQHGGPEAMDYLRVALRSFEPAVRMMAIENIAQTGQRELIVPILKEALSDDHDVVRSLAASLLGQLFPEYYKKGGEKIQKQSR